MHFDAIFFTDQTDNLSSIPPLGAYKCAHVLRQNGYTSLVVNHYAFFTLPEMYQLIDLAVGPNTRLVGFSTSFVKSIDIPIEPGKPTPVYPDLPANTVFPQGRTFEDKVLARFKERSAHVKFVAGGARVNPQFSNRNIDYVCIGYSEVSVVNLMNHLTRQEPLEKSTRNIWGVTVIDDRKAESYDFANGNMQWLPYDVVNHKVLPIEIARGCVFKCKFCGFPLNGKKKLDFVKCTDLLKAELEENYSRYGIDTYLIVDDTFNDHIEKLTDLRDMIQQLSFKPKFWAYHRLDLLHTQPRMVELLADIGVKAMFFGIETLNPASAKIIGKGHDRTKQISTVQYIRQNFPDISMHGNFIIGLPEESLDSVRDSHSRILSQEIPLHSWGFMTLILKEVHLMAYASEIEADPKKFGYEDQAHELGMDLRFMNWKNPHMTFNQARALQHTLRDQDDVNDNFMIDAQFGFRIASMGHANYSLETVLNTKYKDFDFHDVEKNVRPQFIRDYKQRLMQLIQEA